MTTHQEGAGNDHTEESRVEGDPRREFVAIAIEMANSPERLTFPGLDDEVYERLKKEDEEYPGEVTPVDELVTQFGIEGMAVVVSHGDSRNVWIVPGSLRNAPEDVINRNSIRPAHLSTTKGQLARGLRTLIELDKKSKKESS
jgi:hypothetical protein